MFMKCVMVVVIRLIRLAFSSSYQTLSLQSADKFHIYVNRCVSELSIPLKVEVHKTYMSCVMACNLMTKTQCVAVSIAETPSESYQCKFFGEISDFSKNIEFAVNMTTYFAKKEQGICGKKCDVIKLQNLCGNCRCIDSCGVTKKHQCDCTKNFGMFQSCQQIYDAGQNISGKYLIDPDGNGKFEVTCHVQTKDYSNQKDICKLKNFYNNLVGVGAHLFIILPTFYECKQYCYSHMMYKFYNAWTYNPILNHCHCLEKTSDAFNDDIFAYCCTVETEIMPFNHVYKSSAVMIYRNSECDAKYWSKSLKKYEEGFSSADNIWIGLKQLERITAAFLVDIKVIITTKIFKDKLTTYYRNVTINRNSDGFYVLSYQRFDPNNAREEGYFNQNQIRSTSLFSNCNSAGYWWTDCFLSTKVPTNPDTDFGFGTITDIYSIAFLLQTQSSSSL